MKNFEGYRLTLEHFFVDKEGIEHKLNRPIVTQAYIKDYETPRPYVVNRLIQQLEDYMLKLVEENMEKL